MSKMDFLLLTDVPEVACEGGSLFSGCWLKRCICSTVLLLSV